MKICRKCNTIRPLSEFRKASANKDGLTIWCKPCLKAYNTDRRRKQGILPKDKNKAKSGFKICTKCNQRLSVSDFSTNKNNSDSLKCWCNNCINEYNRSDKGKEAKRQYMMSYRSTEQGKAATLRYVTSEKGKQNERRKLMRYLQSGKGKEAVRLRDLRRRTRKAENQGSYTLDELNRCMAYFDNKDAYTGEPLYDGWALDHIVPLSKGGSSYIFNLVPTNKSTNSKKKDKLLGMWYFEQPFFSWKRYDKIMTWNVSELSRLCQVVTHNRQKVDETLINQHSSLCRREYKFYFNIISKPHKTLIYKVA